MTAYNSVNGTTMTEHRYLVNEVLRGEWGFDGFNVSDWMAARSTTGDIEGGLDVAMPGPQTVYGEPLAAGRTRRRGRGVHGRRGRTQRPAPRRPRRHPGRRRTGRHRAARRHRRRGPGPRDRPPRLRARTQREAPSRSGPAPSRSSAPPPATPASSAAAPPPSSPPGSSRRSTASPPPSPRARLTYAVGADPNEELAVADKGFELRAVCRDAAGEVIGSGSAPNGQIQWIGDDLPAGVTHDTLHTVELTGTFTPRDSGAHTFGIKGLGAFTLTVDGTTYFDDVQRTEKDDPFVTFFGAPVPRARSN